VVANNDAVHDRLRELRDHGRRADGEIVSWGLNSRLDNLQAAILDHRLQRYDHAIERRRAVARRYRAGLGGIEELVLPPGPDPDPHHAPNHFDVFQNYEIEAHERDGLRAHLKSWGIGTIVAWGGKAVHQWEALGLRARLPFTDGLFERLLLLPMHPFLNDAEVDYICAAIVDFYRA
jgi:dTDP-4-amino-4,6-dideoxygalactose transaminase